MARPEDIDFVDAHLDHVHGEDCGHTHETIDDREYRGPDQLAANSIGNKLALASANVSQDLARMAEISAACGCSSVCIVCVSEGVGAVTVSRLSRRGYNLHETVGRAGDKVRGIGGKILKLFGREQGAEINQ